MAEDLTAVRWGPHAGGAPKMLVLLLHGLGGDGNDLIGFGPHFSQALPHALFVAPNGPEPHDALPPGSTGRGRQWFSLADHTPAVLDAAVTATPGPLNRFIDAELARLGLPDDAYAMMGFSQGAMTALYVGLRRAVPPRAILAYAGSLLAAARLGETSARPPVLLVHGEADQVVPPARSRAAEAALRAHGVPVEAVFCPGLGHGIDPDGISRGALFLQRAFASMTDR